MRSGKALILATREFAKEDRLKSWVYTISTLFILVFLFLGTLWNFHMFGKVISSILAGLVIVRMFTIYHDFLHGTILQKSVPAQVLFSLFGVFVLSPPSIWKLSHDYHHKHNSKLFAASIGSYPIMTTKRFVGLGSLEKFKYLAVRHPLTIMGGYLFMFLFGMCLSPFLKDPKKHADAGLALVSHLALATGAYLMGGAEILLLTVIIPFSIACGTGAYLFYAQHNFPGVTFQCNNNDWSHAGASMESSSYMVMGPVMRWFVGNIGYHHIHHINAHIPFYRLPEVMQKIPEFQLAKRTSLHPSAIIECLKLKVWDAESQEMIGLDQLKQTNALKHT